MRDIDKLKFKKLEIRWEQHRAAVFNYTAGIITLGMFGIIPLIFNLFKSDNLIHSIVMSVLGLIILCAMGLAVWVISNRLKRINKIRDEMDRIIRRYPQQN